MWIKSLRSAVEDGVREFTQGALSEVKETMLDTVNESTSLVKEAAEIVGRNARDGSEPAHTPQVQNVTPKASAPPEIYRRDSYIDEYINESKRHSPAGSRGSDWYAMNDVSKPKAAWDDDLEFQDRRRGRDEWDRDLVRKRNGELSASVPLKSKSSSKQGSHGRNTSPSSSVVRADSFGSNGLDQSVVFDRDRRASSSSFDHYDLALHDAAAEFEDLELTEDATADPPQQQFASTSTSPPAERTASFLQEDARLKAQPPQVSTPTASRSSSTSLTNAKQQKKRSPSTKSLTKKNPSLPKLSPSNPPLATSWDVERDQLIQQVEDLRNELLGAGAVQHDLTAKLALLTGELEASNSALNKASVDLADAKEHRASLEEQLIRSRQDRAEFEDQLRVLREDQSNRVNDSEVSELSAKLADALKTEAAITEELQESKLAAEKTALALQQCREERNESESQLKEAVRERNELAAELDQAKVEREELEASVDSLATTLEERLELLQTEVTAANALGHKTTQEKEEVEKALQEMNVLLKQGVDERARLVGENETFERQLAAARAEGAASSTAVDQLKAELAAAVATTTKLKEELEAQASDQREVDKTEREALEARLTAVRSELLSAQDARRAAEARAAAAEQDQDAAEEARSHAERLRREAESLAQAAESLAEAERGARAEAQGLSEQLKADTERRALLFNNAVKAAVSRVQKEVEGEKQALETMLRDLQNTQTQMTMELSEARAAAEQAQTEAAAQAAEAESQAAQCAAALKSVECAQQQQRVAAERMARAEAAKEEAEREAEAHKQRLSALEAQLNSQDSELHSSQRQTELLSLQLDEARADAMKWRERTECAQESARAAAKKLEETTALLSSLRLEAGQSRTQAAALAKELDEARNAQPPPPPRNISASSSLKDNILSSLGLESMGGLQRQYSYNDVELALKKSQLPFSKAMSSLPRRGPAASLRGVISTRTWLVIGYLAVLHLVVMVQFSWRHGNLEAACAHWHPNNTLPS